MQTVNCQDLHDWDEQIMVYEKTWDDIQMITGLKRGRKKKKGSEPV